MSPKLYNFGDKDFLGRKIMKKFIKSTLLVIGATLVTLLFMNLFLNAWDNTMPTSKQLLSVTPHNLGLAFLCVRLCAGY